MNTIFDYLEWRGDLPVSDVPFNEVDAAILARFAYEPLDGIASSDFRRSVTIGECCHVLMNDPALDVKVLMPELDRRFISLMYESKRFGDMRVSGFVNEIDIERQTQFAAMVFELDDEGDYYLAFRGTDNTIIGWKEDFNMGFEFPVPAQHMAVEYYENAAGKLKEGTFYIGGHSKGGNLSVYTAAFCNASCQRMIKNVYNFDGPGFNENIMNRLEFAAVEKKILTFVPQFSVVGMILEHLEDYSVVPSNAGGINQHELLTWGVYRDGFTKLESVDRGSRFVDNTLKDWLKDLDRDSREQFVDTLYKIMTGGDQVMLSDFKNMKAENINAIIRTYGELDDKTKSGVKMTLKKLAKSAGERLMAKASRISDKRDNVVQ